MANETPNQDTEDDTEFLPVSPDDIVGELERLMEVAERSGLESIKKELIEEQIPAFEAGEMTVVVLGEFNHGKTTVVNALLGESVLPTGITPTTSVVTHVVHGQDPEAAAVFRDRDEPEKLEYEGLGDYMEGIDDAGEAPQYLEIEYPNDLLSDSLVLVDTPGVNDISRQKVEITYGYLPKSDVIIYVLDSTQVLKKSEINFIKEKLLKANLDRIVFVLSKIDALEDEDLAEVKEYAQAKLRDLIGEEVPLFAFSATEVLEAQKADETLPRGFRDFRDYLFEFLRTQRGYILLDSAIAGGLRSATLIEQNLAIKKQGYLLEKEDLEDRIAKIHDKLSESRQLIAENLDLIDERIGDIAASARHNLNSFVEEFSNELPKQVERADAKDVKLHLSAWIRDSFREWLEEEGDRVAQRLEALAEEIIEITNESMREVLGTVRSELGLRGELDLDVDTVTYDMSVFALGTLGISAFFFANALVGGLLTLATPILAVALKGRVDEKIKKRAKQEGVAVIEEAGEEIEKELMNVIYDYGDQLKEFVETAGERLYSQVEDVLKQVQQEVSEQKDRQELAEQVDRRLADVRETAERLQDFRNELESLSEEARRNIEVDNSGS